MMDAVERGNSHEPGVSLAYIHPEHYNFDSSATVRRLYADQLVIVTAILIVLLSALLAVLQAR